LDVHCIVLSSSSGLKHFLRFASWSRVVICYEANIEQETVLFTDLVVCLLCNNL